MFRKSRLLRRAVGEAPSSRAAGFTTIELLVAIGVLGLLLALLLPAVQSSRAASRRTQCLSNLKALGVALNAHESAKGALPIGLDWRFQLLPYLDQQTLYDLAPRANTYQEAYAQGPHARALKVGGFVVPAYLCPADTSDVLLQISSDVNAMATANYTGCFASVPLTRGRDGVFGSKSPKTVGDSGPIGFSQITDGLSNTVAVSEMLRGNASMTRMRSIWDTPNKYKPDQAEEFARTCDAIPPDARSLGWFPLGLAGYPWCSSDHGVGLYDHVLRPNRPSCLNRGDPETGIFTASSAHASGVNVLYVDGHAEFKNEMLDREVWLELATRSRVGQ